MSSKPKQPKQKPVNRALIAQTKADLDAQTQRINEGLQTYKQQAITNVNSALAQQRSVISNSINDTKATVANTQALRGTTVGLLQRRLSSQQNVNQANTGLAKVSNTQAQRGATVANNKQQAQVLVRRSSASA
jgi:hypothetical protein